MHPKVNGSPPSHLQIYPACPAGRRDPGTWETRQLATAIYPTMALLNHSCDNNVTKGHKNTYDTHVQTPS